MCELFGLSAKQAVCVTDYLKEFYRKSVNHPHGWGLALLEGQALRVEKEPIQASLSSYLASRLEVPVIGRTVIAHIRYATRGNMLYKNCHPYTLTDHYGRRWTLAHNGTIFDCPDIDSCRNVQIGDTDSERILYYIVDQVNRKSQEYGHPLTGEERMELMNEIILFITPKNKVNLMIYDEEFLYVHTNFRDTLYFLELKNKEAVIFATEPLSEEEWQPVPFMQLLVYHEDQRVYEGTPHNNEYFPDE